jgi:hypothetical protein
MAAADVVEVYALIQGHRTPVRIQQAVERRDDGRAVDLAARWVGAECRHDSECDFQGGFCATNAWSGRGFCSTRCTQYGPDRAGAAPTFCVANPAVRGEGLCVPKSVAVDGFCTRYDHLVTKRATPRFNQPRTVADVCLPGTDGWVGDRCLANGECAGGLCVPPGNGQGAGICSQACTRTCPDRANAAGTFCVAAPRESGLIGGLCAATCTTNDDCALGATCELEPRLGQATVTRDVCLPY